MLFPQWLSLMEPGEKQFVAVWHSIDPDFGYRAHHLHHVFGQKRLHQKRIRPELITFVNGLQISQSGKHYHD